MALAMATKDDIAALTTAMEKMFKRLDDMEEKVQSLGWKVVPEGAAEGAAEDHEGEASGPVCAHSMVAGGATATDASLVDDADPPTQEEPKPRRRTRRGRGGSRPWRESASAPAPPSAAAWPPKLLLDGDEGEANETQ